MTATGHAVIGTVIAATISNPLIAAPIAIISHVAADLFPHWDTGTHEDTKTSKQLFTHAVIDVLLSYVVATTLIIFLFPKTNLIYTYFIVVCAQALDWAWAPYYFLKWTVPPFTWAYSIGQNFDNRLGKPWGIINQVAILVLLVIIAKIYFYI